MENLINLSGLNLNNLSLETKTIGDKEFNIIYKRKLEETLLKDGFNLYSSKDITNEDVINQGLTVDSKLLIDYMTNNDFTLYPDDNENMAFIKLLPKNSKRIFKATCTEYKTYNDKVCTIIRPLNDEEIDRFASGNMYEVEFEDKSKIQVFEDEIYSVI